MDMENQTMDVQNKETDDAFATDRDGELSEEIRNNDNFWAYIKSKLLKSTNDSLADISSKIVKLTDASSEKESRLAEAGAELARSQAMCSRLSQEKELMERHTKWLDEELTAKVDSYAELRRRHSDLEAEMSAKLVDVEKNYNECSSSLNWHKERLRELETQITSLQEELSSCKDAATATEEQYNAEIFTANKLVELYKESSEEWSRKAGELEGVIKALEGGDSRFDGRERVKYTRDQLLELKKTAQVSEEILKVKRETESELFGEEETWARGESVVSNLVPVQSANRFTEPDTRDWRSRSTAQPPPSGEEELGQTTPAKDKDTVFDAEDTETDDSNSCQGDSLIDTNDQLHRDFLLEMFSEKTSAVRSYPPRDQENELLWSFQFEEIYGSGVLSDQPPVSVYSSLQHSSEQFSQRDGAETSKLHHVTPAGRDGYSEWHVGGPSTILPPPVDEQMNVTDSVGAMVENLKPPDGTPPCSVLDNSVLQADGIPDSEQKNTAQEDPAKSALVTKAIDMDRLKMIAKPKNGPGNKKRGQAKKKRGQEAGPAKKKRGQEAGPANNEEEAGPSEENQEKGFTKKSEFEKRPPMKNVHYDP